MFDSDPIEIGKIQNGYLTDEQGRRIYYPLLGPARWVPSREEEARFREQVMWWTGVGWLVGISVMALLIFRFDDYHGTGHGLLFVLSARHIAASGLARRWPRMNDESMTYKAVRRTELLRRSAWSICLAIALGVAGAAALIGGMIWGFWFSPVDWSEKSIFIQVWSGYLTAAVGFLLALWSLNYSRNALDALKIKLGTSSASRLGQT